MTHQVYDPERNRDEGNAVDSKQRWWLLGGALVAAIAIGFIVGSAIKSTSAPAAGGPLATSASGGAAQVSVTRVGAIVPVPALRPRKAHTTTSTSSSASGTATTPATTTGAVTSTTVIATTTAAPPSTTVQPTPTVTSTTTGGGGGGGGGG